MSTRTASISDEVVIALVRDHSASLIGFARRYSLCAEDAADAYQRGLEILLEHGRDVDPDRAPAWLRTVVRHEAHHIRTQRERTLTREELDPDRHDDGRDDGVHERVAAMERLGRSAEVLSRLKPHEARALLLRAEGLTYHEICARTGWSYTKVNRLLTEGRSAFARRFAGIESGAECDRWAEPLGRLARAEATPDDMRALRPHLRRCPACRASVRSRRERAAAGLLALPLGFVLRVHHAVAGVPERVLVPAQKLQASFELLSSGKLAALAASTAALAGGGVAVNEAAGDGAARGRHAARSAQAPRPVARPARRAVRAPGVAPVDAVASSAPVRSQPRSSRGVDTGARVVAAAHPSTPSPAPTTHTAQPQVHSADEFSPEPGATPSGSASSGRAAGSGGTASPSGSASSGRAAAAASPAHTASPSAHTPAADRGAEFAP